MAKKRPMGWSDWFMWYFSVLSFILCVVACIPFIPWRYAQAYNGFHQRFPVHRMYSLLMVTGRGGQYQPWLTVRKEVCRMDRSFQMPNLVGSALGLASGAIGTGGAMAGCANWPACKDHTRVRCLAYQIIAITGIISTVCYLIAALSHVSCLFFNCVEFGERKQRKIDEGKKKCMIAACTGLCFSFLALILWEGVSAMQIMDLKRTSAMPWPRNSLGTFVAVFLLFVQLVAAAGSGCRMRPDKEEESDEDNSSEDYESEKKARKKGKRGSGFGKGGGGHDPLF